MACIPALSQFGARLTRRRTAVRDKVFYNLIDGVSIKDTFGDPGAPNPRAVRSIVCRRRNEESSGAWP